jgi:hypothetical protein
VLFAQFRHHRLVAVHQHHPCASREHRLGAGQPDARRPPGDSGDLTF